MMLLEATHTYIQAATDAGIDNPPIPVGYLRLVERELAFADICNRALKTTLEPREAAELAKQCGAFEAGPVLIISHDGLLKLIARCSDGK